MREWGMLCFLRENCITIMGNLSMWGGGVSMCVRETRLINTFVRVWWAQSFTSLSMQCTGVDGTVGTSINSPRDRCTSGDRSINSKDSSNRSSHIRKLFCAPTSSWAIWAIWAQNHSPLCRVTWAWVLQLLRLLRSLRLLGQIESAGAQIAQNTWSLRFLDALQVNYCSNENSLL